jgi:hypothetical protein
MERQTSARLYGSAATGHWVPGRSDLDLIVLLPRPYFRLFGQRVREWKSSLAPKYPILEGYVLSPNAGDHSVMRLEAFETANFPGGTQLEPVDQWNIRNRSKHLFGSDSVSNLVPEITLDELSAWARGHLNRMSVTNPDALLPEPRVELSKVIWLVSKTARLLLLSKGTFCESKREALEWLANEHPEIQSLVRLLLGDYLKTDDMPVSITSEQSAVLRKFCVNLLLRERKPLFDGMFSHF